MENRGCVDVASTPAKGGGINVEVTCSVCGERIVSSDKYGMYCAKKCTKRASHEAGKKLEKFLNDELKMMGLV